MICHENKTKGSVFSKSHQSGNIQYLGKYQMNPDQTMKDPWSPKTEKKRSTGRQEKSLDPENGKKEVYRSPRKILGARKRKKRGVPVAKKDPWSPQTEKKRCTGRQERSLEPANPKKEVRRSPRKILGARKLQKRGETVAKKGPWSPQTPKKRCNGHQERSLEPANPKKEV
jgi:hypothetical protein